MRHTVEALRFEFKEQLEAVSFSQADAAVKQAIISGMRKKISTVLNGDESSLGVEYLVAEDACSFIEAHKHCLLLVGSQAHAKVRSPFLGFVAKQNAKGTTSVSLPQLLVDLFKKISALPFPLRVELVLNLYTLLFAFMESISATPFHHGHLEYFLDQYDPSKSPRLDAIELKNTDERGRSMFATQRIKLGQVVTIHEIAYVCGAGLDLYGVVVPEVPLTPGQAQKTLNHYTIVKPDSQRLYANNLQHDRQIGYGQFINDLSIPDKYMVSFETEQGQYGPKYNLKDLHTAMQGRDYTQAFKVGNFLLNLSSDYYRVALQKSNVEMKCVSGSEGQQQVTMFAVRKIKLGEELSQSYGAMYWLTWGMLATAVNAILEFQERGQDELACADKLTQYILRSTAMAHRQVSLEATTHPSEEGQVSAQSCQLGPRS
ncbi:MAG: hypothetical protein ABGY11_12930 [Candidatus Thioglobus sp.]